MCLERLLQLVIDSADQGRAQLDVEAVNSVYALTDSLQAPGDGKSLTRVLQACSQRVVHLFGNLTEVLTSTELRAQFQQLCPAAVKGYLQREDLVLDSGATSVLHTCTHARTYARTHARTHTHCHTARTHALTHGHTHARAHTH